MRGIKLCRYQLGQIYANNERNEKKLTEAGYDKALNTMHWVMKKVDLKTEMLPQLREAMPFNLTRRLCMQRILEALSRTHVGAPDIAPAFNYLYSERAVMDRPMTTSHEAHRFVMGMLNADLKHRLITPIVHKYMTTVAREGLDGRDAENVIGVFGEDVQPLVRAALLGKGDPDYGFLEHESPRTGYDEGKKMAMLVDLMFVEDKV